MYKPPSIEEIGLKAYLDLRTEEHGGLGYDDFVKLVDIGVNKKNIAAKFGVSRKTMYRWFQVYEEENQVASQTD